MTITTPSASSPSTSSHGATPTAAILSRLAASVEVERGRWVLWIPVGLGVGIAAYFALPVEPPWWLAAALLLPAAGLAIPLFRGGKTITSMLAAAVLLVLVGFASAQFRTVSVTAPVVQERLGPLWLEGRIIAVEPKGRRQRLLLDSLRIPDVTAAETPQRVRLTRNGIDLSIRPGMRARLRAVINPPPQPAAPGAYDFARDLFFRRIGGVGYIMGSVQPLSETLPVEAHAEAGFVDDWRLWWRGLRQRTTLRITEALPGETGAVAAALMTGDRGAIPADLLQAMRDSGLAHLLAISGLHMGLVAGLLFVGLRAALALVPRLALRHPIKKWASVAAFAGAFGYLFMAGASIATQRAFIMVSVILLAVLLDRRAFSLRLVAVAAAAILLVAPESLLSPGFQMSFAAVTALIAGYEVASARRRNSGRPRPGLLPRLGLYFLGVALSSVIAIAATAPFAAFHFSRLAVFGLAANLIAVPLTAFWIMPCALVAFLLMPVGAEALGLVPMSWGLEFLLATARTVAAWPGAAWELGILPLTALVSFVTGGLWLCLWQRTWRLAGVIPIAAGLLFASMAPRPDIFVSGDGRLLGVRAEDGTLLLSSRRVGRFAADIWRRQAAAGAVAAWPETGERLDMALRCDPLGCLYQREDLLIALVRDARALAEDCAVADAVISTVPIPRRHCLKPPVKLDRFDLWRSGAHSLRLEDGRLRIDSVAAHRGRRPWTQPHRDR